MFNRITQWINIFKDFVYLKKSISTWKAMLELWLRKMCNMCWNYLMSNKANTKWQINGVKRNVFISCYPRKMLYTQVLLNKQEQMANYKLQISFQFTSFISKSLPKIKRGEDICILISNQQICIIMDWVQILFLI